MSDEIVLNPVGKVLNEVEEPFDMPLGGVSAVVEIYPQYQEALQGLEENSHVWILGWFHLAPRDMLKTVPKRVNPDLPEYGVFALRSFARPNPIGMSLAELVKVDGNKIYLRGLDALGGTPVLDIKPYYENDIIFSPGTPYIKGKDRPMRIKTMIKHAIVHHQEECDDLHLAVRMAGIAEDELGKVNEDTIIIGVKGTACLADCLQGITRARLANPERFSYEKSANENSSTWKKENKTLKITARQRFNQKELESLSDEELFIIEYD